MLGSQSSAASKLSLDELAEAQKRALAWTPLQER
jgi:hypothetical protein